MIDTDEKQETTEAPKRGRKPSPPTAPFAVLSRYESESGVDIPVPGRTINVVRHDGEKTFTHVGQYGQETESRIRDAVHCGYQMLQCDDAEFERLWIQSGGLKMTTQTLCMHPAAENEQTPVNDHAEPVMSADIEHTDDIGGETSLVEKNDIFEGLEMILPGGETVPMSMIM